MKPEAVPRRRGNASAPSILRKTASPGVRGVEVAPSKNRPPLSREEDTAGTIRRTCGNSPPNPSTSQHGGRSLHVATGSLAQAVSVFRRRYNSVSAPNARLLTVTSRVTSGNIRASTDTGVPRGAMEEVACDVIFY